MDTIRPLYDRVIVTVQEKEEKSAGGIILATEQATTRNAKVIACGGGRTSPEGKLIPLQVKVGDVIIIGKYGGIELGDDRLLLSETEMLGIVE